MGTDISDQERNSAQRRHRRWHTVTGCITAPVLTLLVCAVVWLFIDVGRIKLPFELPIVTLGERVAAMQSELLTVGALARNADRYSHSHGYGFSDARLKEDVRPIQDALASILQVRGVRFVWRPGHEELVSPGSQLGVVAQELEQVYPELVQETREGYKTVDYAKLTPVLIEALREQQGQITELEQRIANLEAQLEMSSGTNR